MGRFWITLFLFSLLAGATEACAEEASINLDAKFLDALNTLNQAKANSCPLETLPTAEEVQPWLAVGFKNPELKTLEFHPEPKPAFTHEFDLQIVAFKDAGWTEQLIQTDLTRVAEIYSQCGIRLAKANLILVDAPEKWGFINEESNLQIAELTPKINKPILYFVGHLQLGKSAYSYPKHMCSDKKNCDTAWISKIINDEDYKKKCLNGYSPIAHELAHILGNRGHISEKEMNILSDFPAFASDQITKEQCDAFKQHSSMRKL